MWFSLLLLVLFLSIAAWVGRVVADAAESPPIALRVYQIALLLIGLYLGLAWTGMWTRRLQ